MALALALLAIIWGVFANSQVILFDGIYTLITVGLSISSLISASYMEKPDFLRFPYGKEMLEPLVILVKFVVITILCLFAFFSGFKSLIAGGQEVDPQSSILYAIIASISSLLVYLYFRKKQKTNASGFVKAETEQWLMDSFLSLAVMVGFVIALGMGYFGYAHLMPYVDPVMVMLISAYVLKVPLINISKKIKEILEMSADDEYLGICENVVENTEKQHHFQESFLRVSKSGPKLFIEMDFVVHPSGRQPTLSEQDQIREEISRQLSVISLQKWLVICFTLDRKWAV